VKPISGIGIRPSTLPNSTNMNSVKMKGK